MLPLISFTVNIPGAIKNTSGSRRIFYEGCKVLREQLEGSSLSIVSFKIYELDTGHEAYFVVKTDEVALKKIVLQLENTHPLGRLFDFDVIGPDGRSVSREDLGYPKRKCLLCEQEAHVCGRSRRHPMEELIKAIQLMVDAYFQDKNTAKPY
jgi:holo-ACP synthase